MRSKTVNELFSEYLERQAQLPYVTSEESKSCVKERMEYLRNSIICKMKEGNDMKEIIKIKKLNENAKLPTRGSDYAAGYDLYACIEETCIIAPHSTVKIGTGLSMELPDNTFGAIFARSGLATKKGLRPSNCVGVCDSDYRGEYIVALHNDSDIPMTVEPNERIAQMILMPYIPMEFEEVEELTDTNRGSKGFGSSGSK